MGLIFWLSTFSLVIFGWHFFTIQLKPQPWKAGENWQDFWKKLLPLIAFQTFQNDKFLYSSTQSKRQNYFRWATRRINFLVLLSTLSFLHLEVNPAIFLVAAILLWTAAHFRRFFHKISLGFFGLGISLWALDNSLRQVSVLFSNIESYTFLYVLMDNGAISLAIGLLLGIALAFVSRTQGVSCFFAVIGLIAGLVSLPVAFAVFIGELIFLTTLDERSQVFDLKSSLTIDVLSVLVSIGLWSLFPILWNEEYSPQLRRDQFLVGLALWLALNLGFRSLFYHFKAAKIQA